MKKNKKKKTAERPEEKLLIPALMSFFEGKGKLILCLLTIVSVGILIYSNTFRVPFLFDDENNVYNSPLVRNISNFSRLHPLDILFGSRIVCYFTFALNFAVNGPNVVGYHMVNLLIHLICALLVFWFCILTFKTPLFLDKFPKATASLFNIQVIFALFTALFFVSHPIQTQAVTYIVQRLASLSTLFYLLSIVMYTKGRLSETTKRGYTYYALSIISAILAMKTKEIAFTLPVVTVLYEFMFFRGKISKRLLYLIPLLMTMVIIPLSLVGTHVSSVDSGIKIDELTKGASLNIISAGDYLTTQFRVIVTYLRLLILPVNQNLDYDYPIYRTFFTAPVILSFLLLLLIFGSGIYLLYQSRRDNGQKSSMILHSRFRGNDTGQGKMTVPEPGDKNERKYWYRLIAFGIFWFFITISVESSIIPIADVIFEHRLYLPSVGFFIATMACIMLIVRRWKDSPVMRILLPAIMILIIIVFSVAAYARNLVWRNEVTLWEDVVKKSPQSYRANFNLGLFHAKGGRFDEAIREFQTAVMINPNYPEVYNNLGLTYLRKGDTKAALQTILTALRMEPGAGYIYESLGQVYAAMGQHEEAIRSFQKAVELNPDDYEAQSNLEKLRKIIKDKKSNTQ